MATKKAPAKKKAKAPNKGGRPSKYSPALIEAIAARLSTGEPMAVICRDEGMPHPSTVRDWMAADPDVSLTIARAREDGEDYLAAECLLISDTPLPGVIEKLEWVAIDNPDDPEGPAVRELQVTERKVEDMLGHRKLQIETRLKLLSKWNPKKYGERTVLAGDADAPLLALSDEQLDARLALLLAKPGA